MKHFKTLALIILVCALAGCVAACTSLQYAGTAEYTVKPFVVDNDKGTTACCEVSVRNGKEMASIEAHITKQGDNITVDLKEQGVQAFAGQQIAAGTTKEAIDAAAKAATAISVAPAVGAAVETILTPHQ